VLPFAERILKNCEFAEVAITKPLQFSPVQLPVPLNQFRNQYFPSLTADGQYLLYTVRQAMGSLEEENLYYSEKSEKGWSQPEQVSTRINTKENEGASSISGDGKTLVYTYCTPSNGCDLYITRKVGKEWLQPGSIGANVNTRGWESHPSLSADGRTLYFAAERAGGIGKEDIWITNLDSNDVWTSPVNAGPKINTPDSDFTPFIHPNGRTLYFASRGWAGMGGTDLFMVDKTNDSTWTEARNLGYPINTFSDELGFTVSSDFSVGYFSKDVRNYEGRYISTLYSFQVPESIKSEIKCIYLKGRVLDEKTNKPIKARIELVNLETGKTEQNILSDGQTGAYLLIVPNKQNYGLFVSSIGYLYQSLHFDSNQEEMLSKESFDILLKPIQKNSEAILRNVFFETKKYDLDSTSATELSKLAKLVRDNHLKIEVGGHTDNVGSPQDNLVLSQKRAQAVVNYLILKGISKAVVFSKGYGETKPKADNILDEGRKMNRRIEIKILE
jgi:OmpA-OmpF porin, OOP family